MANLNSKQFKAMSNNFASYPSPTFCGIGAHVHASGRSNLETDVDTIDYAAHLVAGVLADSQVAQRGLKVGMSQPFGIFRAGAPPL